MTGSAGPAGTNSVGASRGATHRTVVRTDPGALAALGDRLDRLQLDTGVPVMGRRTWLQIWLDTHPSYAPLVVAIESADGSLTAVALLATQRVAGLTNVVAMGHRASDMVLTSARDDTAADLLADGVVEHLEGLRPWNLLLRNVHPGDPLLPRLAQRLPRALLLDGDVSPVLRADQGGELDSYVSSSHRKRNRQMVSRMTRDDLEPVIEHVTDPERLVALLPEIERVHRLRDEDVGRTSPMDKPAERAFFHRLVAELGAAGEVCLTTLRLRGALAAFTLCFVDGADYRAWTFRFDPAHAKQSPGRLVMDEAARHALASGATSFDFMRGEEAYKDSYANDRVRAIEVLAGSNRAVAAGHRAYLAVRDRLRRMDASDERSQQVADRLRDLRRRLRR